MSSKRLTNPPGGGKLRQWEVLGMSRASWYRHGKPTENLGPLREFFRQRTEAQHDKISIRTVQRRARIERADGTLWRLALEGMITPGEAEHIIQDPVGYHRFLKWYGRQLSLVDYVEWLSIGSWISWTGGGDPSLHPFG